MAAAFLSPKAFTSAANSASVTSDDSTVIFRANPNAAFSSSAKGERLPLASAARAAASTPARRASAAA